MTARNVTRGLEARAARRAAAEYGTSMGEWWGDPPDLSEVVAMASAGLKITRAVQAAIERGAITSETSATRWLAQGDSAAEMVDSLAGCDVLARDNRTVTASRGDRPPTRPFEVIVNPDGTGQVPPGRDRGLYAANPLVDEARRHRPALVSAAAAERPEPRLFGDDDLPLSTVISARAGSLHDGSESRHGQGHLVL